jgi:hypothetical protein
MLLRCPFSLSSVAGNEHQALINYRASWNMNLVSRNGSHVIIRQQPILLLCVTAIFSLPFLVFSLFHILGGTDADGKIFCLIVGLLLLWVFLEFVATRERIEIDLAGKVLTRCISGVFINKRQVMDLSDIKSIGLEVRIDNTGASRIRRQYLYMYGSREKFLLNSPSKVYMDQTKLGRILSEVTLIPFQGQTDSN